jgi:peptide/nickel transport system substrate-binding protein
VAGVAIALALVAAGCGDDGGGSDEAGSGQNKSDGTTTTGQPQSGGVLTMAMYSEARGLDPIQNSGTGVAGGIELAALYDTIVRWNPDTQEFENRTAESVTPNADYTQWTLKLRPNITFRDGAPYDANAVKLSFERHAGAQNTLNPSRSHVQIVQSMTVTDPLTITFSLKSSWPGFPYLLADEPGMLVSPKALAALGDPADSAYKERLTAFSVNPVGAGAGPFELESFRPKEAIVMMKDPNYWGGDVYLDEVRFIVLAGAEATLEALKADSIQVGLIRNPETVAEAKDAGMEGFEDIVQAGDIFLINNGLLVTCQAGQPAPACTGQADGAKVSPPTPGKDPKVRQAVAAAIDPETLAERAYSGKALPGSELFQSNYAYDPGVPGPEYDPERAKQLVAEAKQAGWDGKIRITCTNSPERKAIALAAETMLREAGMDVTTRSDIDVATQIGEVVQKKDFDLACWGLNIYPDEGGALLFEQNLAGTSATNRVGYNSPEFDAALAEFKSAATSEEKTAAAKELAEIYNEDIPVYVFGATPEFVAWQPKVHGVAPTQATMVLLDKAWIEQ